MKLSLAARYKHTTSTSRHHSIGLHTYVDPLFLVEASQNNTIQHVNKHLSRGTLCTNAEHVEAMWGHDGTGTFVDPTGGRADGRPYM